MWIGSEKSKVSSFVGEVAMGLNLMNDLNEVSGDMRDSVFRLHELAANDDAEALKSCLESDVSAINCAGLWYVRNKETKKIMEEERTVLMLAASYGSMDVLKFIVTLPVVDLNKACGRDGWTALHCAASGASVNAIDVIKLLLSVGCDPGVRDANGRLPADVIVAHPNIPGARAALEDLLMNNVSDGSVDECKLRASISSNGQGAPASSWSSENRSSCSPSEGVYSPMASKAGGSSVNSFSEKKQYPVDPSFPDIRDSVYSSDEFRMYVFKVRPCSRAYSHDWTECPFAHPGENARRRDPRKYHYSCVPCPDFRKGTCRRGDMCEYAHGVFECWLHPAQYRTRLCKDGTSCARQVCFFAHTQEELRPLYVSTGSGIPSPRSNASAPSYMDMAAALNLLPGSPTSQSLMSPVFNQTLSPSANGMPHSTSPWPQNNVPTLYLPGSNLQSSRLRSSLNARDMPPDYDTQHMAFSDMERFSQPHPSSAMNFGHSKTALTPSNLEDLFSSEVAASEYSDQAATFGVFSPTHKSAVPTLFHPQQSTLPPIKTTKFYGSRNLLQASFGVSSPRMSPRSTEPASPVASRLAALAQREGMARSLGSRDIGANHPPMIESPKAAWSSYGSSQNGKLDWLAGTDHHSHPKISSSSLDLRTDEEEPDLSWVQSLVKEPSPEMTDKTAARISSAAPSGECQNPNSQPDSIDHSVLGAWLEQMQLDQLTA